ncbi:FecR domain-containing protein [Candidatus Thiodiazotropha sp. CDECU1]|uniref:FecR domain-containing protein n=1 Tax=Candidatus Thiodiazotropha sp. CDECU1 TaxID=3065865 RepID=UPI00293156C4|nr:FecR domain-containing protein [Candidatus Thiodiazotropha sp. CDECU1]
MEADHRKPNFKQSMGQGRVKKLSLIPSMSHIRRHILAMLLLFTLSPATGSEWVYTVVDGDNLWDFSEKYLDSVLRFEKLRKLNNIKNPKRLQPGSWLRVPMKWIRSNAVPATLADHEGQVQLTRADGSLVSPIKAGTLIRLGDQLRTGPKSSAAILFADNSALTLHSHGEMKFDHLSAHGETGMVDSRLRLIKGRLQTKVRPSAGPGSRYEIYTPSAISAVRGTVYRAAVTGNGTGSNIEVLEGKVEVSGGEKQQLVGAGFGTHIEQGKAPTAPVKLLPPPTFNPIPEVVRQFDWRLQWDAIEGAVNYRIEVSRDRELAVLTWDQLTDQTHLPLPELPDGEYWVRVRGIDANGLEGNSRVASVLLDTQPQAPLSLNPPDGTIQRGSGIELQWTKSEDADRYLLEIATDQGFEQIVHRVGDLQETRYQAHIITEPGTYYWRVTSILDTEFGPPGVVRSWQLRPALEAVNSTIETTDDKVTASWQHATNSQLYQVQLALDPEFSSLELDQKTDQPEVSFDQLHGQVRYLRVRAIDADGYQGPWGSVQRIEPPLDQGIWAIPILFILGLFFI